MEMLKGWCLRVEFPNAFSLMEGLPRLFSDLNVNRSSHTNRWKGKPTAVMANGTRFPGTVCVKDP